MGGRGGSPWPDPRDCRGRGGGGQGTPAVDSGADGGGRGGEMLRLGGDGVRGEDSGAGGDEGGEESGAGGGGRGGEMLRLGGDGVRGEDSGAGGDAGGEESGAGGAKPLFNIGSGNHRVPPSLESCKCDSLRQLGGCAGGTEGGGRALCQIRPCRRRQSGVSDDVASRETTHVRVLK
ncbi:hypothetical protein BRADI_2g46112v3 [Brachypodium distachyon]|uniref:Uncharacterized protein n=1 Tax=Brachypodium distachyon TaxID=15368 RepID=A0A0Q3R6W2_BRADI|nr:hypothetical protein BRADI_2g46112v3 [Brachypodium distachyon]